MTAIGKYQLRGELGRSGAGATYQAYEPFRKYEFALKVLGPLAALSAESKDQLYAELAACLELSHRHIARIRDVGEVDGGVYLATKFFTGTDLRSHLADSDAPIAHKLAWIAQVCEGLASAHGKGIAHGNIKPSNIFVTESRDAVVLDFAVANWYRRLAATGARLDGLLPNYLAPEQILGQSFDPRSDIFSLAVVLYELVTGRHPFKAAASVIAREIVHADPVPLRQVNPQLPEDLEQIVAQALTKDPQARLQNANEFAAGLYAIALWLRREAAPASADGSPATLPMTVVEEPARPSKAAQAAIEPQEPEPQPWTARSYRANQELDRTAGMEPLPAGAPAAMSLAKEEAPAGPARDAAPVDTPAVPARDAAPADAPAVLAHDVAPVPPPEALPAPPAAVASHKVVELTPVPASAVPLAPSPAPERLVPRKEPVAMPPLPPPSPAARWNRAAKQLVSIAVAAVLALSLVLLMVSRQRLRASQNQRHNAPPQVAVTPAQPEMPRVAAPAAEVTAPAPDAAASAAIPTRAAAPATSRPAPNESTQPPADEMLRAQVKPLWEAGRYAEAMRLVDRVLAVNPASSEARAWKKRIRAAQDAEAAVK
ncbi:MAG TPA: protein kinase [Bryobacteraceae bacterium]|nr:protein kinase [Bryobacteraceae bacterium]